MLEEYGQRWIQEHRCLRRLKGLLGRFHYGTHGAVLGTNVYKGANGLLYNSTVKL